MTLSRQRFSLPLGATVTTVMSMALVLLLAGAMAACGIIAATLVRQVQESTAITLSIANNVMPEQLDSLNNNIAALPQVAATHVVTRSEALQQWKEETGEDLVELLGENPLNASIVVAVKQQWADTDSLMVLNERLEQLPGVVDATTTTRDVDNIMTNARSLMTAMAVAVAVMLVIAVVLIASVVRLLTYSQRLHIHTMTLVGARTWFIIRPYMWRGAAMGLVAAILAAALLLAIWAQMTASTDALCSMLALCVSPAHMAAIAVGTVALGTLVGGAAAALAARRYTRITHDELWA